MKKLLVPFIVLTITFGLLLSSVAVSYADPPSAVNSCTTNNDCAFGYTCVSNASNGTSGTHGAGGTCQPVPTTQSTANGGNGNITLSNPFGSQNSDSVLSSVIQRVTTIFLFAIGLVLFGLIFYAGFLYLTDGASEENTKKAKSILTSAGIGIIIIALTGILIKAIELIFKIKLL